MSEYDDLLPADESNEPLSEEEKVDLGAVPGLMRASDLLPPAIEDDGAEVPPTPEEADLQSLPLAERERIKLAKMTPEQKARYDGANAEIMANPAVAAFAAEEERTKRSKEEMSKAFIAAYRKKAKEKP